ncbi:MAG: uracil-DNA glycosylase [Bacteroidetes bacterium]|nr:uracil-DNA glycosylase [Bacteroidota bacterium]
MEVNPVIHESWLEVLGEEFHKPYFSELKAFLLEEKNAGKTIYPPGPQIFNAFNSTPFNKVKVVVLGQDPYHGPRQAHGLCFSVQDGIKPPPSLKNIYKELHTDTGFIIPKTGNLQPWTAQGVFLLNAILTVEARQPASHQKKGWETFTDAVIKTISERSTGVVFLLWGRFAGGKASLVDTSRHHILTAPHPSPFSAHSGFFGCRHFSRVNELLITQGKEPIDWSLDTGLF